MAPAPPLPVSVATTPVGDTTRSRLFSLSASRRDLPPSAAQKASPVGEDSSAAPPAPSAQAEEPTVPAQAPWVQVAPAGEARGEGGAESAGVGEGVLPALHTNTVPVRGDTASAKVELLPLSATSRRPPSAAS